MRLPKKENIYITGRTDPIARHYHPFIGYFMNKRLEGALRLLGEARYGRLLDVGYGGGVFLPELSKRCDELYAVDIHDHMDEVTSMLAKEGVEAKLSRGDVTALPFPAEYFDGVLCVSVLEFVSDLDKAFSEMARVLKREGIAVIGFPVENIFTDLGFFMIGINGRKAHPANHDDILKSAAKAFRIETLTAFPGNLPMRIALFAHCGLRRKDGI